MSARLANQQSLLLSMPERQLGIHELLLQAWESSSRGLDDGFVDLLQSHYPVLQRGGGIGYIGGWTADVLASGMLGALGELDGCKRVPAYLGGMYVTNTTTRIPYLQSLWRYGTSVVGRNTGATTYKGLLNALMKLREG